MSQAITKKGKENLVNEINELEAFKRVFDTEDGKRVISFVLAESQLNYAPFDISKNSGNTAHTLGRQKVGRAVFDKLVESGAKVDCSIFSAKKSNQIEILKTQLTVEISN